MNLPPLPQGQTRISESVLDTIAMSAARQVGGVMDIHHIAQGAVLGGAFGGLVGLAGGGAGGAVLGASAGSAAGAATAHLLDRRHRRHRFIDPEAGIPVIHLHLSATYGANLPYIADEVRNRVREMIRDSTGVEVHDIEIVFTEIAETPG